MTVSIGLGGGSGRGISPQLIAPVDRLDLSVSTGAEARDALDDCDDQEAHHRTVQPVVRSWSPPKATGPVAAIR